MSFQATEPLTHDNAHSRPEKLDPRVNGPFLDDIRREQEEAYRKSRMAAEQAKETVEEDELDVDDTQDIEPVADEEEEDNADGE